MNDITLDCSHWREVASAALDDEVTADEQASLDRHLATCAACRAWVLQAQSLGRVMRVREAEPVPDQTAAILARADDDAGRRSLWWALRIALGAIGLLEIAYAI